MLTDIAAPASTGAVTSNTRVAVLMACFNRREMTLRCLRSLFAQANNPAEIEVYLVDDASTDGTAAAVRADFPQVKVIAGTGELFWGGGMHLAMSEAAASQADFMLWLNDDVTLHPGALAHLLAADARASAETGSDIHVVVGAVVDPASGAVTYAGFNRRNSYHPAQVYSVRPQPDRLVPCDSMNGNCVLISKSTIDRIGLIDGALIHRYGDIDYGYRINKVGGKVLLAPAPVGTCSSNTPMDIAKRLAGKSLIQRWRILSSPLGTPLKPMFRFMWRHGGVVGVAMGVWTVLKLAWHSIHSGSIEELNL